MKKILIKQIGSTTRCNKDQRLYMKSLGLRKIGHIVERVDNQINRKLINKLNHLVQIVGEKHVVEGKAQKEVKKDDTAEPNKG